MSVIAPANMVYSENGQHFLAEVKFQTVSLRVIAIKLTYDKYPQLNARAKNEIA
jgi:hypothetical protein